MGAEFENFPESGKVGAIIRVGLNTAAGVVPYAGGILAAISGAWSEREQEKANNFFKHWIQMIREEMEEKEQTIKEIMQRLDLTDEKISERISSPEYQSLLKKSFRNWAAVESNKKREYVRNLLANAATTEVSTTDVIRLFLDWIKNYSDLHFQVIACIYQSPEGISRRDIWNQIGKTSVREDSSEADLYKVLIRDLSEGGIIRQHRKIDYHGNFIKNSIKTNSSDKLTSAFDGIKLYELTALGKDFVHYAMTDIPIKIEYAPTEEEMQ